MTEEKLPDSNPEQDRATRFPTTYTTLFLLIVLVAAYSTGTI